MRSLGLIAAIFLTISISACGGNSTAIGVAITAVGSTCGASCTAPNPAVVIKGQNETFVANVSGGSTTTVYWQICIPPTGQPTVPPTQPTNCTPVPGTTNIPPADQKLTGYGTITQTGIYTAPQTIPQTNPFVVMASSTVDYTTAFAVAYVKIDSGIRVQMNPTTATIAEGESYTLTATVTGTTTTGLTWSVNGTAGGNSQGNIGTVTPTGPQTAVYAAPTTTLTANVTATSVADSTQSASASITVSAPANPTIASLDPSTAQQGSAQQDIYITGTNFLSTSTVTVQGVSVPFTWISTSLVRTTIPAAQLAQTGTIPIQVVSAGNVSPVANLTVNPMRPTVVAAAVDSVSANVSGFGLNLAGGYFVPGVTTASFNSFSAGAVATTIASSRQLTVNLPAGSLETPGLYPIVVQNSGLPAGASSTSAINLAVTPAPGSLVTTAPTNTITVGSGPSAIAIDQADGLALVANTGSNSVSVISLSNFAVANVAVGNGPTGVAVDDALLAPLHHLAIVVNSTDNTYSVIDLSTLTVTQTVSLAGLTPNTAAATSSPYSVGINPITHRGFIADTSTNSGTVIDMVTPNPALSCATAPCPVAQIGGPPSSYGTGPAPQVSVDPNLNWAVVASGAGGIGIVNMVDLGRATVPGADPGRAPFVVAAFGPSGSSGVAGVGVNSETHQVLVTIPSNGNFTLFSLLDQTVGTIPFTNQGVTVNQPGYVASAVSALPNIGVAVNSNANTAAILDLQNHLVVENVTVGSNPVAVAIDAATNQALVANQADGTVSVLSLGVVRSTASGASQAPQITLLSPGIAYTSANNLTLTLDGGGFAAGAQVFLDGTAVDSAVSANGRQIVATVPAAMLSAARRYSVYVQNSAGTGISNIEPLIVVQPITVGNAPFGVGLDTDCDVAAVTNSADNTVSIISLTPNAAPPGKVCVGSGTVGTVGSPISVGTTPQGIDVEPRFGLAVVANNGSNNSSVVDLTEVNPPTALALCGGTCTGVTAVAFNHDTATAEITDVEASATFGISTTSGNLSGVTVSLSSSGVPSGTSGTGAAGLDLTPTDVAVDPYIQYLAVTTAGQTSNIDIINLIENSRFDITNLTGVGVQVPSGIIFDPVNQVFVVANSLVNNVVFVDPVTQTTSTAQVGMNPTSLDYDYQNSTLVTANNASNTLSVLDYICPPSIFTSCSGPGVREILPFSGSPQFSVKVDAKLNIAILADQPNNRVLLIPLP